MGADLVACTIGYRYRSDSAENHDKVHLLPFSALDGDRQLCLVRYVPSGSIESVRVSTCVETHSGYSGLSRLALNYSCHEHVVNSVSDASCTAGSSCSSGGLMCLNCCYVPSWPC